MVLPINGFLFDFATAIFASVCAFFWAWSAMIKVPVGYDLEDEQQKAFKKMGKLNSIAAGLAAIAAAIPALKAYGIVAGIVI